MKWHKGPPPSVGWWPASTQRVGKIYRWWNGEYWSRPAFAGLTAVEADFKAAIPSINSTENIWWAPRPKSWPARSHT